MSDTPNVSPATPPKSAWERHVIEPIVVQLTQGITPEKIALTLSVGSALALFPILGTTTLLCLLAGILLKLNQPIIQMVNAVCTPLHLPVILLTWRLGGWAFHDENQHMGIRMMNHLFWEDPKDFVERFGAHALHAIVAWAAIAPVWCLATYFIALPVLREILRKKAEAGAC